MSKEYLSLGVGGSKMKSETKLKLKKQHKTLRIMLLFLEIRKSIIKIPIKGGESKIIHKFEILHQNMEPSG